MCLSSGAHECGAGGGACVFCSLRVRLSLAPFGVEAEEEQKSTGFSFNGSGFESSAPHWQRHLELSNLLESQLPHNEEIFFSPPTPVLTFLILASLSPFGEGSLWDWSRAGSHEHTWSPALAGCPGEGALGENCGHH
uniref:Uncharacterized protein n=1 Tax=Myotis myotis TaxID=51298 RepID=A0A7J7XI67_MYOMY|nr:hypothetical protein mMyoMyo1_011633 [Myotis myotis]